MRLSLQPRTVIATSQAMSSLPAGASVPLTLPVHEGFPTLGIYHARAFADSMLQVTESSEGDNTYGPLTVNVTKEGLPPTSTLTGTAALVGWTWVSINGVPVPQGTTSQTLDRAKVAKGAELHEKNCARCHVENGKEIKDNSPVMAGQWVKYLEIQMADYHSGKRKMFDRKAEKMKPLSQSDLDAIAHFYASVK